MTKANESKSVSASSRKDDIEDGVVIDSQAAPTNNKRTPQKSSTKVLWFFTLVNLLLILSLGAAGYWYYMQALAAENARVDDLAPLKSEILTTGREVGELNTKIIESSEATSQSIDSLLSQVFANNEANQALAKQLSEVSGRRPSDWLLAEANYLVNMAGRKLYLEHDLQTSMTLLREADARLQDLDDPSLLPIRELIATDVQTLQQVNPVSTTSIALTISGMLPQISQLPLENLKLPEPKAEQSAELSNNVSDWQQNLSRTWHAIVGDFISIKRVDEPLSPYLSERQQWLIEQQLKHALSQAQTAALDEQYALYQAALQQAVKLVVEHYQIEHNDVSQFVNALQTLQSTNFERAYPTTLSSLDALKDAVERRLQRQFNNQDNAL
jgi:uroporphyrin-3 C-methyltransferase